MQFHKPCFEQEHDEGVKKLRQRYGEKKKSNMLSSTDDPRIYNGLNTKIFSTETSQKQRQLGESNKFS